jgi:hypothetical protein
MKILLLLTAGAGLVAFNAGSGIGADAPAMIQQIKNDADPNAVLQQIKNTVFSVGPIHERKHPRRLETGPWY